MHCLFARTVPGELLRFATKLQSSPADGRQSWITPRPPALAAGRQSRHRVPCFSRWWSYERAAGS